jgi:uncharacterized protein DUF4388
VLQGTFDTLSLPELLGLLAHSQKTGTLWLEAGPATAAIYLADGRCCAAQSGDLTGKVDNAAALLSRVVELCFSAARQEDGAFRFGSEEPPWVCPETVNLDAAVDELARLLDEWLEIQAVIPTLDARIRLTDELAVEELVVDRERWALLVAIDGRRTVRELVRKTNRPTLEICHAIVALVEAGAITVVHSAASPSTRGNGTAVKAEPKSLVKPEDPYGPGVESPQAGPGAGEGPREEPGAGKGDYLRVFTALKDR